VLGAGEKARLALSQGDWRRGGSLAPRQCCWSQSRGVLGAAAQGLVWETGWTPRPHQGNCSQEECFHQSDIAVENLAMVGKCFLKGENCSLLRSGVLCLLETCTEK